MATSGERRNPQVLKTDPTRPPMSSPDWSRGLSLQERRDLLREPPGDAPTELDSKALWRLRRWRRMSPFSEDEWFERRLRSEGLDLPTFLTLLNEPPEALDGDGRPVDDWIARVNDDLGDGEAQARTGLPELPGPERGQVALVRLVSPLLLPAAYRVLDRARQLAGCNPDAFDADELATRLYTSFVPLLASQVSRVGVLELHLAKFQGELKGETPEERFAHFIMLLDDDEYRLRVFTEYPVLVRMAATAIRQWEQAGVEFLERFSLDRTAILRRFAPDPGPGKLVSALANAGDSHRDGRTVFQLRFASGWRLVYKPRSIALDRHYHQLTDWLAERGGPAQRCPRTLPREGYGWCEFIHHEEVGDEAGLERFYRRMGSQLATLWVLGATDFHRENLIAAGEFPVLVDYESILSPRLLPVDETRAVETATFRVKDSVLRVGLLPERRRGSKEGPGLETSGMGGAAGQTGSTKLPRWQGSGTDGMHLVRRKETMTATANRPSLDGQEADPREFLGSLVEGFEVTCRLLSDHRSELTAEGGPLRRFTDDPVRVILRHTRLYSLLLYHTTHPDALRDALDKDRVFDRLWFGLETGPELDKLMAVIGNEKRELWNGDVPYFETQANSRALHTGTGDRVAGFFTASALDEAERRLARLDAARIKEQVWYIRAAMTSLTLETDPHLKGRRPRLDPGADSDRDELRAGAEEVGRWLLSSAIHGSGDATWVGLTRSSQRGWVVTPAGFDLYSGLTGISLFLAYLGQIASDDGRAGEYTELSRAALGTVRQLIERFGEPVKAVGGYAGWGGLLHAWTHFDHLWGTEPGNTGPWRDEAWGWLERIAAAAPEDESHDVLSGGAGAILPLLAFGRLTASPRPIQIATAIGDRLLETTLECPTGIGWGVDISRRIPLTGFSHGAAGFTWALAHLHAATGDGRYREAALASRDYENSLYSRKKGNWPDLRPLAEDDDVPDACPEKASFMNAWCHGAPGIALGRLEAAALLGDDRLERDFQAAHATTRRKGMGGSHCLCHGDLGNLEVLLAGALATGNASDLAEVRRRAASLLRQRQDGRWLCGVPTGVETPGLLVGMAGIGYQLLRLAEPERVPSILTLAPPVGV